MARGGSRGRRTSYVRDNSGRFASTPGGGPPKRSTPASRRAARAKVTGGTLGARGSLRRSRAKLAAKNPVDRSLRGTLSLRAQKGAATKGANRLGKVRAASTVRMAGKGPAGVIRGGRKVVAKPVAAQPKPSIPARKPAALKWEKPAGSGGRRQTASLPNGRRVNVYSDGKGATASIFNERDRSPVMDRKDFRNVTEAKKWAASPSARGPRILGRYQPSMKRRKAWEMPTDASPSLANIQGKKARPSGTLAKPRNLKPGAIAARKAKAAASSARAGRATTNYNRAQKAALEAQQRVNRRRSPKNLAALARADKSLKTAARAYRILVGLGGEKMAVARKPSPKGAGPRMKAARPASTIRKPEGLAVRAIEQRRWKTGSDGRKWPRANVSFAAMARRLQSIPKSEAEVVARRNKAESMLDLRAERSGQFPKSANKRADYFARATKAERNRRQNAMITAQRAKQFYEDAIFASSNFGSRSRFTTQQDSKFKPPAALTSYFSAWRGYSYTPRKPRRRR